MLFVTALLALTCSAQLLQTLPMEPEKIIQVKNMSEITLRFKEHLTKSQLVVFHMTDTDSFLAPMNSHEVSLDAAQVSEPGTLWIEIFLHPKEPERYYGFVPVTPCMSAEYSEDAWIEYTVGESAGISLSVNSGIEIGSQFLVASVFAAVKSTFGFSRGISLNSGVRCMVPRGQIGQIWLRPKYIEVPWSGRKGKYVEKLNQFLMSSDIFVYPKVLAMSMENACQYECVTNDIVRDLNCTNVKIGQVNFDHPVGLEYF